MSATIVLTDPPELVKLKREFRALDQREQELKESPACVRVALGEVRARKAQIARACFQIQSAGRLSGNSALPR